LLLPVRVLLLSGNQACLVLNGRLVERGLLLLVHLAVLVVGEGDAVRHNRLHQEVVQLAVRAQQLLTPTLEHDPRDLIRKPPKDKRCIHMPMTASGK
jgi:hypothetical protein